MNTISIIVLCCYIVQLMDKEKERRVEESKSSKISMSDEKAAVLEEMSKKVNHV